MSEEFWQNHQDPTNVNEIPGAANTKVANQDDYHSKFDEGVPPPSKVISTNAPLTSDWLLAKMFKIAMLFSKIRFLGLLIFLAYFNNLKLANCQTILFSNQKMHIHAMKNISEDQALIKNLSQLIRMILIYTDKSDDLNELGKSLANLLEQELIIFTKNSENMFYQDSDDESSNRKKRSLNFIGDIINAISGVPSNEMWQSQQELNQKILKIAKLEHNQIKKLKTSLSQERSSLSKYLNFIKNIVRINGNNSIELQRTENDTMALIDVLTLNTRAQTLIQHARNDMKVRDDIIAKAKLDLPSRHLFPIDKLLERIHEQSLSDKVNSPVFMSKKELYSIYDFQCCKTYYHKDTKTIHSMLEIPSIDYSDVMVTMSTSTFDIDTKNRLHELETLLKKPIDRILCNQKQMQLRIISTLDLQGCSKHLLKDLYICNTREILIKTNQRNCSQIVNLPSTIGIRMDDNHFLINRQELEPLDIICHDTPQQQLESKIGSLMIYLPSNCTLSSKSIKIGKQLSKRTLKDIQEKQEIVIVPLNVKTHKPFSTDHSKKFEILLEEQNKSAKLNHLTQEVDLEEEEEELELEAYEDQAYNLSAGNTSIVAVTALILAGSFCFLIIPLFIWFKRLYVNLTTHHQCKNGPCKFERQIRMIEEKVNKIDEFERKLGAIQELSIKWSNLEVKVDDIEKEHETMKKSRK